MSSNILGISEEAFKALSEKRRSESFLFSCRQPGVWLNRAYRHKRGADIIYEVGHSAYQRNMERLLNEIKDHSRIKNTECVSRTLEGQELLDYHDVFLIDEYMLLLGYALECVLKGYLLAIRPELVKDDRQLHKVVITHNLSELCDKCSITLSSDEKELLKIMTRHIIWGKYTVPIKVSDMPSPTDPTDQKEKSLRMSNSYYERRVQVLANNVFDRVSFLLEQQRQRQ